MVVVKVKVFVTVAWHPQQEAVSPGSPEGVDIGGHTVTVLNGHTAVRLFDETSLKNDLRFALVNGCHMCFIIR